MSQFSINLGYRKMLSEKFISEIAFSDHVRSGFSASYRKRRFLMMHFPYIKSDLSVELEVRRELLSLDKLAKRR